MMDLVDGMRAFVQVVSAGSFTRAADRLGVSKNRVSKSVAELESRLGSRLLHRTTRSLSLTEAGALYHAGCVRLLGDLDELEQVVHSRTADPRGRLLVSAPVTFGEMYLTKLVGEFCNHYADVSIDLRLNDRFVNLVEEGFDLAIRIGDLDDSDLVARKLAPARITICAAPSYFAENGMPEHPTDLKDHDCIIDTNFRPGANWPFVIDGARTHIPVTGSLLVNSARAAKELALGGRGIAMCPDYVIGPDLETNRLMPILRDYNAFEVNVYAVFNNTKYLPHKTRTFIEFLSDAFNDRSSWNPRC